MTNAAHLELLPAVDVADGQAVRLVQGEAGTETSYGSPLEAALQWQRDGAEWVHLVDLDAAFGRGSNRELLAQVVGELDVKVEMSGGIRDDESLEAARARGTVVLFGGSSGQVPPFDLQRLNTLGALYVTRPSLAYYVGDTGERSWRWRELTDAVTSGDLTVRVGGAYPLADAARAHADLESRKTQGKLLLTP